MSQQMNLGLTSPKLTYTEWKDGPPPSEGWWPASRCEDKHTRRWFSATSGWSKPASGMCDVVMDRITETGIVVPDEVATHQEQIQWCGLTEPHPDGYTYELKPTI